MSVPARRASLSDPRTRNGSGRAHPCARQSECAYRRECLMPNTTARPLGRTQAAFVSWVSMRLAWREFPSRSMLPIDLLKDRDLHIAAPRAASEQ